MLHISFNLEKIENNASSKYSVERTDKTEVKQIVPIMKGGKSLKTKERIIKH